MGERDDGHRFQLAINDLEMQTVHRSMDPEEEKQDEHQSMKPAIQDLEMLQWSMDPVEIQPPMMPPPPPPRPPPLVGYPLVFVCDVEMTMSDPWRYPEEEEEGEKEEEPSEMAQYMKPAFYRALITGDTDGLMAALNDTELCLPSQVSPHGNTILHIAANKGHEHLVEQILSRCPDLFKAKNSKGDVPLHLAASAGHLSTAQSLISNAMQFSSSTFENSKAREEEIKEAVKKANEENNTPLHLALKNRHKEVAIFLFDQNEEASCCLNKEGKSPLYMAVEAGYVDLVTGMMEYIVQSDSPDERLKDGKSIVHAAIGTRNKEVLDKLLRSRSSLMDSIDENGRTPLSYAASIGYLDGVCYILDSTELSEYTYKRDRNGFYPIHMASRNGHINIIQEFLMSCPDSSELLNRKGQNILHVAAKKGRANVVSYMLKMPELENLINERDKEGNTALHLASRGGHPKVVSILTWDKRVSLELVNKDGETALDVIQRSSKPSFRQRLTWQALRYANAPRALSTKERSSKRRDLRVISCKDRVNTLLLVAILVATVTFAAGFTMPGGNNDSDPNNGMAIFFKKHIFHVFLISNTIAMYSSIVVAVVLIWAQLEDDNLVIVSLKLALPLLGIALTMVSSAFMAGVYLAVSNLTWLANFILIIGSVFLLVVLVLFVPLFLPSVSNRILRYILYYPFYLLILVSQDNADDIPKIKKG